MFDITSLLTLASGYSFCPLLMPMSEAFSISFILNESLLHRSSEWSSLVSGPGLNSSPPGAKNPGVLVWFNNNLSSGRSLSVKYKTKQMWQEKMRRGQKSIGKRSKKSEWKQEDAKATISNKKWWTLFSAKDWEKANDFCSAGDHLRSLDEQFQ